MWKSRGRRSSSRTKTEVLKRKALLTYKQTAPIRIHRRTRATEQQARRTATTQRIREVRTIVFVRDSVCRVCEGKRKTAACIPDELHEDPPRSKTRGLSPEVRFSSAVCIRLCTACHEDVTRHRIRVVKIDPGLGFDGRIVVLKHG